MKKVNFNGKLKSFFKGRGFMLVLFLSVAAIGTSTYIAYVNTLSKVKVPEGNTTSNVWVFPGNDDKPVDNPQTGIPKGGDDTSADDVNKPVTDTQPLILPVQGEVSNAFSNNELVKSNTLGTWRTHDGIDIKADVGTEVKSMSGGTVKEVREDTLWGIVVVIEHTNGTEGFYANLQPVVPVKAGEKVEAGKVIGTVGQTAEIEISDPPHLHFGLKSGGKWIDPLSLIKADN